MEHALRNRPVVVAFTDCPRECENIAVPTVARIAGGIRIDQHYAEHNPPHFHAIQGDDEVLLEIALPLNIYSGGLKPGALQDVRDWAKQHRAALALNWVDAQAQQPIKKVP